MDHDKLDYFLGGVFVGIMGAGFALLLIGIVMRRVFPDDESEEP